MTTELASRQRSSRTAAMILSGIACGAMTVLFGSYLFFVATTSGASTMVAVVPLMGFVMSGWAWAILAILGIVFGSRADRPRVPVTLAGIALGEVLLFALILLSD